MKVILLQTVPKVGKADTVVTVADGFARNYLFPRHLAILADKVQIKALERKNERLTAKLADAKTAAEALKEKLNGQTVRIEAKIGKVQGKLFGAITNADVAEAIEKQLGAKLEKKQVALIEPIKKLGSYPVELDLHREVDAIVTVEVFDPAAPVAPVAEAKPAETDLEPALA